MEWVQLLLKMWKKEAAISGFIKSALGGSGLDHLNYQENCERALDVIEILERDFPENIVVGDVNLYSSGLSAGLPFFIQIDYRNSQEFNAGAKLEYIAYEHYGVIWECESEIKGWRAKTIAWGKDETIPGSRDEM